MSTTQADRVREFLEGIGGMSDLDFANNLPTDQAISGGTIESQADADERIPGILSRPGHSVIWAELTGYVDFREAGAFGIGAETCNYGESHKHKTCDCLPSVDWLILSGSPTEPTDLDGLRRVIADCREAGVPVFVRSVGARPYENTPWSRSGEPRSELIIGDPTELHWWPEDLRARQVPTWLEG